MTGNALVFLQNKYEVQKAKEELHMRYIGKRYIEILSCENLLYV